MLGRGPPGAVRAAPGGLPPPPALPVLGQLPDIRADAGQLAYKYDGKPDELAYKYDGIPDKGANPTDFLTDVTKEFYQRLQEFLREEDVSVDSNPLACAVSDDVIQGSRPGMHFIPVSLSVEPF